MELDTQYCNICKETVLFHKVTALTEVLELLKFLIEQINCKLLQDSLICEACLAKLQSAYEFKNLYSKNSNIKIEESTENNVTCEICRSTINADDRIPLFDSVTGTGLNLIKYLSRELELKVFENCPTCETCHKSLLNFYTITELLSTFDQEHIDCINDSNKVNIKLEIPQIETDCDVNVSVQEENNCMSTDVGEKSGSDGISYKDFMLKNEEVYLKMDTGENPEAETTEHSGHEVDCNSDTDWNERNPSRTISKPSKSLNTFQCDLCKYQTNRKFHLKVHLLRHKNSDEVKMFKCPTCEFQSKYKSARNKHVVLTHKSSGVIFKCQNCEYTTKYEGNLKKHTLVHKNIDDAEMFKCESCDFKTKRHMSLKQHLLRHKSIDEVELFKCPLCEHKTKNKYSLKGHMVVHKNVDTMELLKCKLCDFRTKHRTSLRQHKFTHVRRDSKIIKMFKCQICDFQTRNKSYLPQHMLKHKDVFGDKEFKCENCQYQTNFKSNLKSHLLVHKVYENKADMELFQCKICEFKTKYKCSLRSHMLVHKSSDEFQLFHCGICQFKTKYKHCLKNHIIRHHNEDGGVVNG